MAVPASPTERIFYDGDCGVCHWSVGFVARHDPTGEAFRFAPLEGETFRRAVPAEERRALPDSMIVHTAEGEQLLRSDAVRHILSRLGRVWRILGRLLVLIPRPIRDWFYDRFAERRHRLSQRPDGTCPILPPELRRRFDP